MDTQQSEICFSEFCFLSEHREGCNHWENRPAIKHQWENPLCDDCLHLFLIERYV